MRGPQFRLHLIEKQGRRIADRSPARAFTPVWSVDQFKGRITMKQYLNRPAISVAALALGIVGVALPAASASAAARPQIATQAHASSTCNGYLPTGSVAAMAATTDGGGYWIADSAGLVAACGDAPNLGSVSIALAKPIVGMASTPDGGGFWLVASDGGIFTFGDAQYFGSTGALHLNRPIVGMTTTTDGNG